MKTRNLIGGAIVVAFIAGGYLGGFFPKFGGGTGIGLGEKGGNVSGEKLASAEKGPEQESDRDAKNVLHVRINGREYAIVQGERVERVALDQLVARVQDYPGDSRGIRVRVTRLPNSKTTAELQLKEALVQAGLSEDEIDWPDGPRP